MAPVDVNWSTSASGWNRRLSARQRFVQWVGRNWARLAYSHFIEPVWLQTHQIEIPIRGLDPRIDGLRIVHLSDFHLCSRVPIPLVRQAIESARRQQSHLVALTGDFIHSGDRYIHRIAELLGRLEAPLGVFAVLGNHDYSIRNPRGIRIKRRLAHRVREGLERVGIQVLHNESRVLWHQGSPLAVAGVADLWSRECDVDRSLMGLDPAIPRILLAHNPRTLEGIGDRRCDLMLSGHTHGGQVDLGVYGRPTLTKRMRAYAAGLVRHPTGYLYVNRGIGFTVRFRFRVRPEVAVLRLVTDSAPA